MNSSKPGVLRMAEVSVVMSLILCCVCYCSPVSYREDVQEVTTTPKSYQDRFTYKLQHKTRVPPSNDSSADNGDEPHEFENDNISMVKSVMPGDKTMRQSDEDDDDDDDGGEYEGFDSTRDDKLDRKKPQQNSRPNADGVAAMPMMFIRELDMVAVQIPMKDHAQDGRQSAQKEWSEWSPCSRPCRAGRGLQSRWRVQHGVQSKEQQFRPCYLADCDARDMQLRPSFRWQRRI